MNLGGGHEITGAEKKNNFLRHLFTTHVLGSIVVDSQGSTVGHGVGDGPSHTSVGSEKEAYEVCYYISYKPCTQYPES